MIFAVDFDGTVVTHKFPDIGESVGAERVLKSLIKNGHKIVLNTMRSHMPFKDRDLLQEAVDWFKERDIELYGVNETPGQKKWTDTPKVFADMYIDDAALGCPKTMINGHSVVDWKRIDELFKSCGIINTVIL